jgi:imidazole glycerol-phosphate synthase subunit HisH
MIVIIDYGLGNLTSVANALRKLAIPFQISNEAEAIQQSSGLILPGVGAAGEGMKYLKNRQLDRVIIDEVKTGKPLLGICLGMQLLFSSSDEGNTACLDIVKGKVKKFETSLKVPQIGWNQVESDPKSKLLKGIKDESFFYFVHSYYCTPQDETVTSGVTKYDQCFCSVLEVGNVFGVQFHPEKSGEAGLRLLDNFWKNIC